MREISVYIHTGVASVTNGAVAPLGVYFDLAKCLDVTPEPGHFYGDDKLTIPEKDWPIAQELLIEAKMLYRLAGSPYDEWLNRRKHPSKYKVAPPVAA